MFFLREYLRIFIIIVIKIKEIMQKDSQNVIFLLK